MARLARCFAIAALTAWVGVSGQAESRAAIYDLAIVGGRVISGLEGAEPVRADVGIVDGEIVKVGRIHAGEARQVIDAGGELVAPGFVDLHTHAGIDIEDSSARR